MVLEIEDPGKRKEYIKALQQKAGVHFSKSKLIYVLAKGEHSQKYAEIGEEELLLLMESISLKPSILAYLEGTGEL